MSIKISTLVWAHYHSCPSEKLTALAYADHAQDDGTRVRPSVAYIARKTGQSERTVQRYLAHMRATGWLLTVRYGDGGRNKATEYRINPEWLRNPGQLITSARNASERSVNLIEKGDTGGLKRVTSGVRKGDNQSTERASAVSPQSSLNPLEPTTTREMPGKSILESTDNFLWPAIFSEHLQASGYSPRKLIILEGRIF